MVRYITNYATKGDCSQYQRTLAFAIARKALEKPNYPHQADREPDASLVVPHESSKLADQDKFALRTFNRMAYDREISGFLAASTLLQLSEFYTPKNMMLKRISTDSIRGKFPAIIFPGVVDVSETKHRVGKSMKKPATLFDNYQHRGEELKKFSSFDYMKLVDVVQTKKNGDIVFSHNHLHQNSSFQRPLRLESACKTLVSVVGSFSTNKAAEDAVHDAYVEIDAWQNDMGLILLALFIPWQLLSASFQACNATPVYFEAYCWQIWLDLSANIEQYARFYANNILQMRKSQLECQLDRKQRKAAKAAVAEAIHMENIAAKLDDESSGAKPQWEDGSHPDWLHMVFQTAQVARMQWQSIDTVNAIKYPVILHLQHFLHKSNDNRSSLPLKKIQSYTAGSSVLLKPANLAAGIAVNVPKSTVDNWKAMQKLARNPHEKPHSNEGYSNIGLDVNAHALNLASNVCFELTIGLVHSFNAKDFLNQPISTSVNNCYVLTNQIHQILPLNSFQQLIVRFVIAVWERRGRSW